MFVSYVLLNLFMINKLSIYEYCIFNMQIMLFSSHSAYRNPMGAHSTSVFGMWSLNGTNDLAIVQPCMDWFNKVDFSVKFFIYL